MKKRLFIMGMCSLALILTSCSKGEKEYVEEIPEKNVLDENIPIPADTGTLELKEQRFESANLILQLPEGVTAVEGESDDLFGYVTVTDDAGEWEIQMEAFVGDTSLVNDLFQNWVTMEPVKGTTNGETERFSKKIDWCQDIAGTVAGYPARVWANNTAGVPYEPNPLQVPAVDIVIDYGDQYVGRYYGIYMRLQFQHPVENDNIYEILYRRAVRAIINNFSVIEDKEITDYTANGVTVSIPARWNTKAEERSIVAVTRDDQKKSFVTAVIPSEKTPEEQAELWGEVISKQYGERSYAGVINDVGTEDNPNYSMYLFTTYNEEDNLLLQISVDVLNASKEEFLEYIDRDDFKEIMESIQIDPSVYSDSTGAKVDGLKVQYGQLIEYSGTEEHVVVPSVINGFAVEGISILAFQNNTTIKSVELPDTVTRIDHHAFNGCTNLESVKLPESITEIAEGTFEGCSSLTDISLPASVTEVGKKAFQSAGVGSFEAKGAAVYGEQCFELSGFETISLADGSDLSADNIFRQAAITSIQLPSDLTSLGEQTFYYCENLTELVLPDTVTEIGARCFVATRNLRKLILSQGLTELPEDMTSSSGVVNLSIPQSVSIIRRGAVEVSCAFLYNKDVLLEDGAMDVYYLYLDGAHGSEDVPQNIENQRIFSKIYIPIDATVAESDAIDEYYVSLGMDSLSWFGPSEALTDKNTEDYIAEDQWLISYTGDKKFVYIPAYTENGGAINWISENAFAGNTTIEGISFSTINSINSHSFEGCTNLKEMWFGRASFSFLDNENGGGVESEAFVGIPEGVTVYFPECLTDEEFQTFESKFRAKGMPDSTVFTTFTVEELTQTIQNQSENDNLSEEEGTIE